MKSIFKILVLFAASAVFSLAAAGMKEDFFRAMHSDNASVVRELIEHGFNPNTRDEHGQVGLLIAMNEPSPRVIDVLIEAPQTNVSLTNRQGESALMLACLRGQMDLVKKLLARDAAVNKTGWTPLHYAAAGGHVDIIRLLLENYAFIDAESPNGTTPLMMAAGYGNDAAVKLLLDEDADTQMRNQQGMSAADFALRANRTTAAKMISSAIRAKREDKGQW